MAENPVLDVLRRGEVFTEKLKALLEQPNMPQEVAYHLIEQISGVFSEAIATSQIVAASPDTLQSSDDNGTYTNSSKKRRTQVPVKLGGRKRADPSMSTKVLKETPDDEFTWRKYGQKEIFSAKHPRSYFRCTHKSDENCQATRQVQQSEKYPGMYEITYLGSHTCKQAKKHCREQENSYIINFNSNTNNTVQPFTSSPPLSSSIKQEEEHEEDAISNQTSCSVTTSLEQEIPLDFLGDSFNLDFDETSLESWFNF